MFPSKPTGYINAQLRRIIKLTGKISRKIRHIMQHNRENISLA